MKNARPHGTVFKVLVYVELGKYKDQRLVAQTPDTLAYYIQTRFTGFSLSSQ